MAKKGNKFVECCMDNTCYWHHSHWGTQYENGCTKLQNIDVCVNDDKYYTPIKEGLKSEYPEKYAELYKKENG